MTKNVRIPQIRFKGFTDPWEQRELWNYTIWDKKFNGVDSYKQPKIIKYPYVLADVFNDIEDSSGDVRLLSTGAYIGYTTKEKAGANLCNGEIVAIPWGGVANVKYFKGFFVTADNRIATSNNTEKLSNRYLHRWMESNLKQIQDTYRGASIQHPSMNDILSLQIHIPTIQEQEEISNVIDRLDNLITLHQCKDFCYFNQYVCENRMLKTHIRTITWEQCKVYDLLNERNEQAPMSKEFPLMAFIANEGVAPKGDRYDRSSLVNDTENKLYKKTKKGDFIYSSNNLETGSIGLNNYGNASISPVYSIFYPTELADSEFIGRRFIRKDFINEMVKWRQGVIYGQWRIHESDFLKIEISTPSVLEQQRIGVLLKNIDNLITLHLRL